MLNFAPRLSAIALLFGTTPYNDSVWSVPQSRTAMVHTTCRSSIRTQEKFFFVFCQALALENSDSFFQHPYTFAC